MFLVTAIARGAPDLYEQLGTKKKFWYDEERRLFKIGREGTGENWAEVVCARLADQLGLPHAKYDLATYEGIQGVTTLNIVPQGGRLVLGNELIGISPGATGAAHHRRRAHTVARISGLMRQSVIHLPENWDHPAEISSAADTFTGYLLLDALVANQDRHEQNWGLVVSSQRRISLAPTFDHASSLGRNETDNRRAEKLRAVSHAHSIEGYALRAVTPIYGSDGSALSTVNAFKEFLGSYKGAGRYWLQRLSEIDNSFFEDVMNQVPSEWISDLGKEFAAKLMTVNKRRLLELEV